MNLADIEFDHDRMDDAIKHRKMGAGVTYELDGVLFSSGFVALRFLDENERVRPSRDEFDDMSPAELRIALRRKNSGAPALKKKAAEKKTASKKTASKKVSKKSDVRKRADDKLKGFKPEDQPDYVQQALSENHVAKMAEVGAE